MTAAPPSGPWLQTVSGRAWCAEEPEAYDYTIEELAHALAHLCRFAGHTRQFYSVAQHSVLVARIAYASLHLTSVDQRREAARGALLHDAAEAFVIDMPAPLKRMPQLAGYRELIQRVEDAIARQFGLLGWAGTRLVREADLRALATEKRDVLGSSPHDAHWGVDLPPPVDDRITRCQDPIAARESFLRHWESWQ